MTSVAKQHAYAACYGAGLSPEVIQWVEKQVLKNSLGVVGTVKMVALHELTPSGI